MRTTWISCLRTLALAAVLCVPAVHSVAAQEVAEGEDPPDRVARLSYRKGDVTLEEAGSAERSAALLNRPLTTGDQLWAGEASRAELQVGSATLHLDEYTGIELRNLGDDDLRVALNEGVLTVHVRDVGRAENIEIDTPNATVSLTEPGEYSIEVNQGGDTTVVKVRDGASTVASGEQGSRVYHVDAGRQGIFTGDDRLSAAIDKVDGRSDFEKWADDREERAARSESTRYVSREVIGYEDLDEYGYWHSEPEYGHVWYPRTVVAGWAPYRYGHWVWVGPWGWTWMDDAPWGFAPFHYGRWAYVGSRWGWVPGPRAYRPVYAPALVAWVGGPSVSVSVSFGSGIGWFPLGPREVYVPGYRASPRHINNVNISNTVIINSNHIHNVYVDRGRNEHYAYRGRGDAVTVVSRDDFTRGRPVDRHQIRGNDWDRGNVEPNTLSPDRGRDRSSAGTRPLDRAGAGPEIEHGRNSVPRGTTNRDSFAQEDHRRSQPGERFPSADRSDNRDAPRGENRSGDSQDASPRTWARANVYRPAVSTEKQDRTREVAAVDGREQQYRQPAVPETERRVPRGELRTDRPERESVRSFNSGNPGGKSYGEQRSRSFEPSRGQSPVQASPQPQVSRQFEQPRGNAGGSANGGVQYRGQESGGQAQKGGYQGRGGRPGGKD